MSSRPAQRQSTQTFVGVSTRDVSLRDCEAGCLDMCFQLPTRVGLDALFGNTLIDVSKSPTY
jgi:hypothetical protein